MTNDRKGIALAILGRLSGRDPSQLQPEMELVGDLGIDSPKALEVLIELEETLGIEISDEDAAKMDTVGDILSYLSQLVA